MRLTEIIFDWAGTVVDQGSRAHLATLQEVFAEAGLAVTTDEVRLSIGIAKRVDIASIQTLPRDPRCPRPSSIIGEIEARLEAGERT